MIAGQTAEAASFLGVGIGVWVQSESDILAITRAPLTQLLNLTPLSPATQERRN